MKSTPCRLAALPLVALALAMTARPALGQATIAGTWFTEDSSSKITITQSGTVYTGKVTWVKAEGAVDVKNTAPGLRTRPILGIDILTGCTGDATSAKGCRIYAPRRGTSYDAELSLDEDGTLKVKVKAGIGGKDAYVDARFIALEQAAHRRAFSGLHCTAVAACIHRLNPDP